MYTRQSSRSKIKKWKKRNFFLDQSPVAIIVNLNLFDGTLLFVRIYMYLSYLFIHKESLQQILKQITTTIHFMLRRICSIKWAAAYVSSTLHTMYIRLSLSSLFLSTLIYLKNNIIMLSTCLIPLLVRSKVMLYNSSESTCRGVIDPFLLTHSLVFKADNNESFPSYLNAQSNK